MKKTIKLNRRPNNGWVDCWTAKGYWLCHDALVGLFEIPDHVETIWVTVSDKPLKDAYEYYLWRGLMVTVLGYETGRHHIYEFDTDTADSIPDAGYVLHRVRTMSPVRLRQAAEFGQSR